MAKATWVKIDRAWKQIKNVWVKVGSDWKQKSIPKGNLSGIWKEFISYILNWVLEFGEYAAVEAPAYIQADEEGNSYFRYYRRGGYGYYIAKYTPDGRLLAEKQLLTTYTALLWYLCGDYIYYQVVDSSNSGPIRRIHRNTLEITTVIPTVSYRANFIKVDESKDILYVGVENPRLLIYKLSTGVIIKNITLPAAGYTVYDVDQDYYYIYRIEPNNMTISFRKYMDGKLQWSYDANNYAVTKYLPGVDSSYIYLLQQEAGGWKYYKIDKATGKETIITPTYQDLISYGSTYQLNDTEDIFYVITGGKVLGYTVTDFSPVMAKPLPISATYKNNANLAIRKKYVYFAIGASNSTAKSQVLGKELVKEG